MATTFNVIECPNCGYEFRTPAPTSDTDVIDCTNPDCKASITVDLSYELPDDQDEEETKEEKEEEE